MHCTIVARAEGLPSFFSLTISSYISMSYLKISVKNIFIAFHERAAAFSLYAAPLDLSFPGWFKPVDRAAVDIYLPAGIGLSHLVPRKPSPAQASHKGPQRRAAQVRKP